MQLRRIRVESFRKLVEPVEVAGLPAGMAVIGGANEEGKSTLLHALRSALFNRHGLTGQAAAAMQPLGRKVGPEVELDFSLGGREYRLWKRFCVRPGARLEGPGVAWADEAAEDALQGLLGFERPGRGAGDLPHHGLWGLLWVSQGSTFEAVEPSERARRALGAVLEEDVDAVLGGAVGQDLLRHFAAQRDGFWGASGRPVKALRKAEEDRQARADALAAARERLTAYEARLGELERVAGELARFRAEDREGEMQRRLTAAQGRARELEQVRGRVGETATRREAAAARLQQAAAAWAQRRDLREEAARTREKTRELEEGAVAMVEEVRTLEAGRDAARRALEAAGHARDAARREEQRLLLAVQRRERETERRQVAEGLERARAAREAARAARQEAGRIRMDAAALESLRAAEQDMARAEARLSAAATELTLAVNVPFQVTGEAVPEGAGYRVTGEAALELTGVGRIGIRAGGTDLAGLEDAVARARAGRDALLEDLAMAGPAEAEAALARKRALESEAEGQERLCRVHAPAGLEALESRLANLDAALEQLPGAADLPAEDGELAAHAAAARTDRGRAEEAAEAAGRTLSEHQERVRDAREGLTGVRGRLAAARPEAERAAARLEAARAEAGDDALAQRLSERRAEDEAAAAALRQAEEAVAALDPADVHRELEDAERAVEQTRATLAGLETRRNELRAALRALGQQGLAEEVAELEREAAEAERLHRALEREALAARLAAEALEAAARTARAAWLEPLLRHLRPYLQAVFPGAEPVIGEDLRITGLTRGHTEDFGQLSIGAREQLAILTRLAFADLLAEQGEPPPVILDDALVYADETRFETMKALLSRSARRHQVVILTCRPREYLSLGAEQFRLY